MSAYTAFSVGSPVTSQIQVLARGVADWSTGGPNYLYYAPQPDGCFLLQVVAYNSTGMQPATISVGTPANGTSSLLSAVATPVVAGAAARVWSPAAQIISPGDVVVTYPSNAASGKTSFIIIGFLL